MNTKQRYLQFKKGEHAAKLSAVVIAALSIMKGIIALLSGSVALLASTIHSFSDIFSSIAVSVGLKLVQKKPSERFPYGYYKTESFALLIVSLIIVTSSLLILIESFEKLFETSIISFSEIALAISAISAVIYYLLSRYKEKIGRQIGSQALVSESFHSRIDVYTSISVFIGILISSYGYQKIDVFIGFIIGLYVLKKGLWSGKDAVLVLLDVSMSPERVQKIIDIAESVHGVKGTHNVRLRKSGPIFFGEMHVELQEDVPLEKAHMISDEIEARIKKGFRDVESIVIHVGLAHKEKIKIALPIAEDKGLNSTTYFHFGIAPFFGFIEFEKGLIQRVYVKVNKAAEMEKRKGITAAHFLVNEEVSVVLTGDLGEGPFHVLRDNLVKMYYLPEQVKIEEAIQLLNQNKLEPIISPIEKNKKR
jgi:cation diffusion facilitator family transporter